MKRKTLTLAICFLALIAIVSVGFASWIITAPSKVESDPGAITAEAVSDSGYALTIEQLGSSNPSIHYGAYSGSPKTGQYSWLTNDRTKQESLDYSVWLVSSKYEFMSSNVYVNIFLLEGEEKVAGEGVDDPNEYEEISTGKKTNGAQTKFNMAQTDGYIALPSISYNQNNTKVNYTPNLVINTDDNFGTLVKVGDASIATFKSINEIKAFLVGGETVTPDSENTEIEYNDGVVTITGEVRCRVNVHFNWGSFFGAKEGNPDYTAGAKLNPEVYYSYIAYTESDATAAKTALNAIKAISDASTMYKVVFSDSAS